MNRYCIRAFALLGVAVTGSAVPQAHELIIVDHLGGVSALPYYRALNLGPRHTPQSLAEPAPVLPPSASTRYNEADMLPVRSDQLTPGPVERRAINVPGLKPLFLIGDDDRSRAWLRSRSPDLRALRAFGLVVNVSSTEALASLRRLVPDLILTPASGDDLAARLGLHHYPALITATDIEQ